MKIPQVGERWVRNLDNSIDIIEITSCDLEFIMAKLIKNLQSGGISDFSNGAVPRILDGQGDLSEVLLMKNLGLARYAYIPGQEVFEK